MLWDTGEDKMIDGLILSIQFLTRLPIKKSIDFNDENFSKSIFFFSLGRDYNWWNWRFVLLHIGFLNEDIGSFFALLSMIIVTGGLHLDGLSDTCDGFLSYRDKG